MSQSQREVILFNYPESVFGRRMVRYLNLRQLKFSQIRVAPNMPRPLLHDRLGIRYRRIPLMAIGRDVYIDTRLMLRKLETLYPDGKLGSPDSFEHGFEDMLEEFIIDGGPFNKMAGCIPVSMPLVQDDVWMKDRSDGSGGAFSRESLAENQGWCISQVRSYFDMLEKMLKDGREWVLKGGRPGMVEVHAGWVFDWAVGMGELDGEKLGKVLNEKEYPKVHAWVRRWREAADEAERANKGAGAMDDGGEKEDEVVKKILSGQFVESDELDFDENDVLGLFKGQKVSISPVDFGFTHQDVGKLVGLTADEAVIESEVPSGSQGHLRLHYPRINMKIKAI